LTFYGKTKTVIEERLPKNSSKSYK